MAKLLDTSQKTRRCYKCKKVFVLDIGFHKNGDGYQHRGKACGNTASLEYDRGKKDKLIHHLWGEEANNISVCKRCGIQRKRTASTRFGHWNIAYYENGRLIEKPELCIALPKK